MMRSLSKVGPAHRDVSALVSREALLLTEVHVTRMVCFSRPVRTLIRSDCDRFRLRTHSAYELRTTGVAEPAMVGFAVWIRNAIIRIIAPPIVAR